MRIDADEVAIVRQHLARSLYAQEWADWADRAGFNYGEVMNHVPRQAPAAYFEQADDALAQIQASTKLTIPQLIHVLATADNVRPSSSWLEGLGHDLGMMATGTGVSWFDDHEKPDGLTIKVNIYGDGIGWDMPDEWYAMPVKAYRFKFSTYDFTYKFPITVASHEALAIILEQVKDGCWPGVDISTDNYTFERL